VRKKGKRGRGARARRAPRAKGAKANPSRFSTLAEFIKGRDLDVFGEVVTIDYVRDGRKGFLNAGKPHYHDFDTVPTAYYDAESKAVIILPVAAGEVPRTR
jgi:hypothetical protein